MNQLGIQNVHFEIQNLRKKIQKFFFSIFCKFSKFSKNFQNFQNIFWNRGIEDGKETFDKYMAPTDMNTWCENLVRDGNWTALNNIVGPELCEGGTAAS